MHKLKYVLIILSLSMLVVLEPFYLGPFKFAILWKLALLYLGVSVLFLKKSIIIDKISIIAFLLTLFCFIVYADNIDYFEQTKSAVYFIFIPFLIVLLQNIKLNRNIQDKIILCVAISIVIVCIPYYFGILESYGTRFDLETFGLNSYAFLGPFQTTHTASVLLAVSSSILLFSFFNLRGDYFYRILFIILFFISIFFVYKTYVRTGYLVCVLSNLYIVYKLKFKDFGFKNKLFTIIIFIFVFFMFEYINQSDVVFSKRIADQYTDNSEIGWQTIGSGRLLFAFVNINHWLEVSLLQKLFGIGYVESVNYMYNEIGQRIISHNLFLDLLIQHGVIGLLLYLIVVFLIFKSIRNSMNFGCPPLYFSIYLSYITYQFVQGSNIFLFDVLLVLSYLSSKEFLNKNVTIK
ncbi:O-antigen ligase family protein [Alteromonas sp. LMIT006]|uniref:O-antigen ligase family protein n=1 Tax=Alteromonadaceae TaxID=72275 RepID=UPI0020CA6FA3|nr:O-antigen ligase family protein [Alteromonas sp. LMIT006]UTP71916.1 O-antigen ligase family protein [Alteromonas sp. LMIT006]